MNEAFPLNWDSAGPAGAEVLGGSEIIDMILTVAKTKVSSTTAGGDMQASSPGSTQGIQEEIAAASRKVQKAFRRVISELGGEIARASELQKRLGAGDYRVCWQVFEVATEGDPIKAAQHVPKRGSVKKLLESAEECGVSKKAVAGVQEALGGFEEMVAAHSGPGAGGRGAFDAMVASMAGAEASEAVQLRDRRAAFRHESQLWGAQVEMYLQQVIFRRTANGSVATGTVVSKQGFHRLRAEARPIMFGGRVRGKDGSPQPLGGKELEEGVVARHGAPLLTEFSSRPLPKFKVVLGKEGWMYHLLDTPVLGRTGAVDLSYGTSNDDVPFTHETERASTAGMRFVTPTERAVFELMIHRPTIGEIAPQARIINPMIESMTDALSGEQAEFVLFSKVESLGPADRTSPAPRVRRHREMTDWAFEKLGWDASEFDVYRVSMEYPILNTTLALGFRLPSVPRT